MRLLDQITVRHSGVDRYIKLYVGDLAALPVEEAVDLLVVSAFPDDYAPTAMSLIGALDRRGVSLEQLARDKAVDLRGFSSCWLSRELPASVTAFRRVLCFEPLTRGLAAEVVGDIFRSIIPFTTGSPPIRQVAMPLVAAGDQGNPRRVMLTALVDAAVHWLSAGLPLDCIKIVIRDRDTGDEGMLEEAFAAVKAAVTASPAARVAPWRFDLFVSYSHKDKASVDFLVGEIKRANPSVRLFLDRLELRPGAAWQQHIYDALEQSRKVATFFSPPYLQSKVCVEEYNIAHTRHRESAESVLLPVYLRSAPLPTYMRLVQYIDAREGEAPHLTAAATELTRNL
jgi:hypothetical protein